MHAQSNTKLPHLMHFLTRLQEEVWLQNAGWSTCTCSCWSLFSIFCSQQEVRVFVPPKFSASKCVKRFTIWVCVFIELSRSGAREEVGGAACFHRGPRESITILPRQRIGYWGRTTWQTSTRSGCHRLIRT